jgi:hypothetical protein
MRFGRHVSFIAISIATVMYVSVLSFLPTLSTPSLGVSYLYSDKMLSRDERSSEWSNGMCECLWDFEKDLRVRAAAASISRVAMSIA